MIPLIIMLLCLKISVERPTKNVVSFNSTQRISYVQLEKVGISDMPCQSDGLYTKISTFFIL